MPAKSKNQQKAAGAALAAKRGELPKSKLKGASREMAQSMTEQQLREIAATKRKPLPRKKQQSSKQGKTTAGEGASSRKRSGRGKANRTRG